jgi:hypothetical protein
VRWRGVGRRPRPAKSSAADPRAPVRRVAKGGPAGRTSAPSCWHPARARHLDWNHAAALTLNLPPSLPSHRLSDARRGKVFLGGLSWDTAEGAPASD